jgi:hypothetical protein
MIRKLALLGAAAATAVGMNAPSHAVTLPVANVIWVSGSTALDNAFKNFMLIPGATPCTAGTIDTYENNAKSNPYAKSNQYTIIVCTLNVALGGFAAGTNVAFSKESNGGSVEGTTPVSNRTTTLNFLDPTVAPTGCAAGVVGVPYAGGHDGAFTDHTACTGTVSAHIPDVGLADENPQVFTIGPNAATNTVIANLTTSTMFQNMFGVGVSLNLYRALQVMEGLSGTAACPANSDLLSCMPSLSKQQVRTLMAAGLNSSGWGAIVNSASPALPITDKSFNGNVNNVSNTVFVCRRGDTSGTQAAGDIYLLNNRCQVTDNEHPTSPGGNQFVQATTTAANCTGLPAGETPEDFGCTWAAVNVSDTVFPGTGTGDVASCLVAHDSNPATNAAATFAIGVIATNNTMSGAAGAAAGAGGYRLVALDGGHPTVQALANGTYDFAMDNVVNVAKNGSAAAIAFQALLASKLTTAGVLGDIIVAQPTDPNFGAGGLFDNFTAGAPLPTAGQGLAATKTTPTSALTQLSGGTTQNDCLPPVPGSPVQTQQVAEDAP